MTSDAIKLIDDSLKELTNFQHATVRAACARIHSAQQTGSRILIADEVGLGKTLVARGILALILRERILRTPNAPPLRVVYICSNLALAQENTRKLAIFRDTVSKKRWVSTPSFGRLAELGIEQPAPLPGILLELASLTPATSFVLSNGDGTARERYIIWSALANDRHIEDNKALREFFQNNVEGAWDEAARWIGQKALEPTSLDAFHSALTAAPRLSSNAEASAERLGLNRRSWRTLVVSASALPKSRWASVAWVRSRIRELYVECCAQNLKADLFILDEFQRFRDLIAVSEGRVAADGTVVAPTEQQVIAQKVLHQDGPYNTILLSATPFKALSHVEEDDQGTAHSHELNELIRYLSKKSTLVEEAFKTGREALLQEILHLPDSPLLPGSLNDQTKRRLEQVLRSYICRTERGQLLPDIAQLMHDVKLSPPTVGSDEIASFVRLDHLAESLKAAVKGPVRHDALQFFKATPWCLSFLSGYQLHENLKKHREVAEVAKALKNAGNAWIPWKELDSYKLNVTEAAPSARLRELVRVAAPTEAERLLWLPPSLPAYENDGPFADKTGFSKTLLFSALVLAPRAISSFVSYEAERRLMPRRGNKGRYFGERKEESPAFQFKAKGMSPAWSLIYACRRLANAWNAAPNFKLTSLEVLHREVGAGLAADFKQMVARFGSDETQQGAKWFTLAPFLLDVVSDGNAGLRHVTSWLGAAAVAPLADARRGQLRRIKDTLEQSSLNLGKPPRELLAYLVDLAIGGPGVCLYRTQQRVWPQPASPVDDVTSLAECAATAIAFVDKMNRVESQRVLRAVCPDERPWHQVAKYGAMGNFQAVVDEYAHLLKSTYGEEGKSLEAMRSALGLRAVTVAAQMRLPTAATTNDHEVRFHCHYAVTLGNQKSSDDKSVARITNVRAAFNSPFWPFMLNSTSIGQEGLDFHWYCRRVVHWSLPPNPIDLEQREGRVNRYKSLVVRQRAAELYQKAPRKHPSGDIWNDVFAAAVPTETHSDLVPYWHVPGGSAQIERIVPAMPFSTEVSRLDEILRILSLYRLAFGQPRQQELVENLLKRQYTESDLEEIRRTLLIDLAPVSYLKADECPR